jgi:hypothetical protein
MGGPERGGDSQWLAKALAQRFPFGLPRRNEPEPKFVTPSKNPGRPATSKPEVRLESVGTTENVVTASLDATVEAFVESAIVWAVKVLANAAHPGLGHVISVALKVKEVLDDVNALATPDSSRDLHVPLLGAGDGIELDLNVHLAGHDEAGDHAPLVSGFVAPGDGGLFGGWQLEIDRGAKASEQEAPRSEQDTWTVLAASTAPSRAGQADRAGSYGLRLPAELTDSLAMAEPKDDRLRTVIMRKAASRLQGQLHALPEFADKPVIVIYDRAARLGMWLVKPDQSKTADRQRIGIRVNLETGLTTVFLR